MAEKVETLAAALEFLVREKLVPGLLPEKVTEAASLLREQNAELEMLRKALASKHHTVDIAVSEHTPYQRKIRATFVVADPRIYYAEVIEGDRAMADRDYAPHLARRLVRTGTADWVREMEELAFAALAKLNRTELAAPPTD